MFLEPLHDASAVASAPGKLILFGEHACVYGHTAVAAAISDLRIIVQASLHYDSPTLYAVLHDLPSATGSGDPVAARVHFHALAAALSTCEAISPLMEPAPPTVAQIECLSSLLPGMPEVDRSALLPLLFLCAALLPQLVTSGATFGVHVHVRSADLPLGAGLGSSAAFSVALSAALLKLQLHEHFSAGQLDATVRSTLRATTPVSEPPGGLSDGALPQEAAAGLINSWAYAAECILHGQPSGLDNAVSHGAQTRALSSPCYPCLIIMKPLLACSQH